jgi:hypothetical protein
LSEWSVADEAAIIRDMRSESDRGCMLLCAAFLDRGLEKLLRVNFEKSSDATQKEIDSILIRYPEAALGNLTMRARYAHAQGLIDRETSEAIREFANKRNSYAHQDSPPPLGTAIGEGILRKMPKKYREDERFVEMRGNKRGDMTDGRWLVVFSAICLHYELKQAIKRVLLPRASEE